jgi:hypothetical protein
MEWFAQQQALVTLEIPHLEKACVCVRGQEGTKEGVRRGEKTSAEWR